MTDAPIIDFERDKDLSVPEIRALIQKLEDYISQFPQAELPLKHYFSKGVYGRELTIPKGTLIVGKIHKYAVMNVLTAGEVSVLSIDGVMRIKAPHTFVSSPGAKRVIYAHSDAVWMNFHGTDETDVEKIEEEFIAKSYSEVPELVSESKEALWHTSQQR